MKFVYTLKSGQYSILLLFFLTAHFFGYAQGVPNFNKLIGDPNNSKVTKALPDTANKVYYAVGYTDVNTGCFIKLDSIGRVIFSKSFSNNVGAIHDLIYADNGEFILLSNHNNDIQLIRVDANGNIIWSRTYDYQIESNGKIIPSGNDHYIVAANSQVSGGERSVIVFKIYGSGIKMWTFKMKKDDIVLTDLTTDRKGGCVITGNAEGNGKNNHSIFAVKVDLNGNGKIFKELNVSNIKERDPAIVTAKDSGYTLTGVIDSTTDHLFVLKLNDDLSPGSSILLDAGYDSFANDIIQDSSGSSYHISSQYTNSNGKHAVIIGLNNNLDYSFTQKVKNLQEIEMYSINSYDNLFWSNASVNSIGFGGLDGFIAVVGHDFGFCYTVKGFHDVDTLIWHSNKWAPTISGITLNITGNTTTINNNNLRDTVACCPVVANFTGTYRGCIGDTLTFYNDSKNGLYFNWKLGGSIVSNDKDSISIHFPKGGHYRLYLETGDSTCVDLHSMPIFIDSLSPLDFPDDTILCPGQSLYVFPLCEHCDFEWWDGEQTGQRQFTSAGTYWLRATHDCGTILDTFTISYHTTPSVSVDHKITPSCNGLELSLKPHCSDCKDMYWLLPNNETIAAEKETLFPLDFNTTEYPVKLIYNYANCTDTLNKLIPIIVDGLNQEYIPNVFTPNGDGVNDCFKLIIDLAFIDCYEISIFNRWGTPLFTSKDIQTCWDGTFEGKKLAKGVYFYLLQVADQSFKGTIHLQ